MTAPSGNRLKPRFNRHLEASDMSSIIQSRSFEHEIIIASLNSVSGRGSAGSSGKWRDGSVIQRALHHLRSLLAPYAHFVSVSPVSARF
jgi:hypothetical protein